MRPRRADGSSGPSRIPSASTALARSHRDSRRRRSLRHWMPISSADLASSRFDARDPGSASRDATVGGCRMTGGTRLPQLTEGAARRPPREPAGRAPSEPARTLAPVEPPDADPRPTPSLPAGGPPQTRAEGMLQPRRRRPCPLTRYADRRHLVTCRAGLTRGHPTGAARRGHALRRRRRAERRDGGDRRCWNLTRPAARRTTISTSWRRHVMTGPPSSPHNRRSTGSPQRGQRDHRQDEAGWRAGSRIGRCRQRWRVGWRLAYRPVATTDGGGGASTAGSRPVAPGRRLVLPPALVWRHGPRCRPPAVDVDSSVAMASSSWTHGSLGPSKSTSGSSSSCSGGAGTSIGLGRGTSAPSERRLAVSPFVDDTRRDRRSPMAPSWIRSTPTRRGALGAISPSRGCRQGGRSSPIRSGCPWIGTTARLPFRRRRGRRAG